MSNFIFGAGFSRFSRFSGFFGRRGLKPRLRGVTFCRSRSPDLDRSGSGDFALSVVRGPVPRDRCLARDRPSPYGKTWCPLCRARAPDLDPFGLRRSRTTVYGDRPVCAVSNRASRGFDFQFDLTWVQWICYHFEKEEFQICLHRLAMS